MILALPIIISLVIGFLTGGSLAGASELRLRALPLLMAGFLIQMLIFTPLLGTQPLVHEYGPYMYIGSMLTILLVILLNLSIPGVKLIALGATLNTLAIISNGGFMPSPESALHEVGLAEKVRTASSREIGGDYVLTNSTIATEDTNFAFLGDVIPMPDWVPFTNVVSIGDIVIAIGAGVAILGVMHRRTEKPRQPRGDYPDIEATTEMRWDSTMSREPLC